MDQKNNYELPDYVIPGFTRDAIKDNNKIPLFEIQNYSLLLNRIPYYDRDPKIKRFSFYKTDKGKEIINHYKFSFNEVEIKKISTRHLDNAKSLLGESNIKNLILSPDWRMALGLGNESVYETSIALHHIYGIPYIPASAIKGVVRSWIITNCFNSKEKDAIQNQIFCDMFGCPESVSYKDENEKTHIQPSHYVINDDPKVGGAREGKIIFFDAFPTSAPNIEPDIMNNHYLPYYNGEAPPADYHSPNPIFFLTVRSKIENGLEVPCKFRFITGHKNKAAPMMKDGDEKLYSNLKELLFFKQLIDGKEKSVCFFSGINMEKIKTLTILELTQLWMELALRDHGIGAKTAVGYGYMK